MGYKSEGALAALIRARGLALDLHESLGQLALCASRGEVDVSARLFTIPGAASELGVATTTIFRAVQSGTLPAIEMRGGGSTKAWAIRESDLNRFREKLDRRASAKSGR